MRKMKHGARGWGRIKENKRKCETQMMIFDDRSFTKRKRNAGETEIKMIFLGHSQR